MESETPQTFLQEHDAKAVPTFGHGNCSLVCLALPTDKDEIS